MAKRTWSNEEIALLAQHKVPQGRSLNAARIKAWELHIPFRPNDPNAEPTVPPLSSKPIPTKQSPTDTNPASIPCRPPANSSET